MKNLGLLDTIWAIIIGHLGITIPFVTWLMLVIINDLPKEIEESAMIESIEGKRGIPRLRPPYVAAVSYTHLTLPTKRIV